MIFAAFPPGLEKPSSYQSCRKHYADVIELKEKLEERQVLEKHIFNIYNLKNLMLEEKYQMS